MSYITSLKTDKKYTGNVVIQFNGIYFAIRQPDSGLVIPSPYDKIVSDLALNPTSIDIRRVTTTIATYSFRMVDKDEIISQIIAGNAGSVNRQTVKIWLGRSNLTGIPANDMDFADYLAIPDTKIEQVTHTDNSYYFKTTQEIERINRPIYTQKTALAVDVLDGTTIFISRDSIDDFPAQGYLKVGDEFVSYFSKNDALKRFIGVVRGEFNSIPIEHKSNTEVFLVERVVDHPIDIILKILVSGGGGSAYDVLQSGLAIDQSLIDITAMEELRDTLLFGREYSLTLYDIDSALKYIEDEILQPNNLRFTTSPAAKITVAALDKAVFVDDDDILTEDSITKFPSWVVDNKNVVNRIIINWDFDEGRNQFGQRTDRKDSTSIALYGEQKPLEYSFKGIQLASGGTALVEDYIQRILARLSVPNPEISVSTQVNRSLQKIGDLIAMESSKIPADDGTLNFAGDLETIQQGYNAKTGDVTMKLAFTSFTAIRSCYIAPSDNLQTITDQKTFSLPAGRGTFYKVGWVMRLWNNDGSGYTADLPNVIANITGDVITMTDDFVTALTGPNDFRFKFADYDEVGVSQQRYCFINSTGNNFDDGKQPYKVTY